MLGRAAVVARRRERGFSLLEVMLAFVLLTVGLGLLIAILGGGLPNALDDLVTQPGNAAGWLGPYAKPEELRDPWGTAIEYRRPGTDGPFELVSLGADAASGGESFDADIRKP